MHHEAPLIYFQTALPPVSSYAISKIAGEQYIVLSGVPHTIFRLANMYGPRNVSGPIPTFWKRISNGEPCTVVNTRRDMVYIDDLVDAVMEAIRREVRGKLDICSGQNTPIRALFQAVADAMGSEAEAEHMERGEDDVKQMELSNWRATINLGWEPKVPLQEGVARAVEWYEANGVEQTFTHLNIPERTKA